MLLPLSAAIASPFAGIALGSPPTDVPTAVVFADAEGSVTTLECNGKIRGLTWTVRNPNDVHPRRKRLADRVWAALEADGWRCERGPELAQRYGRAQLDLCRRTDHPDIVVHDVLKTHSGHLVTLTTGATGCNPILGDFDIAL